MTILFSSSNGIMNHVREFIQDKTMDIVIPNLKKRVDLQLFEGCFYFSVEPTSKTGLLLVVPVNGLLDVLMGFRFNFNPISFQSN